MDIFKRPTESKVVREGLNLSIEEGYNYHEYVYFAHLPHDLAGVTFFGGDILINSKYNHRKPLDLCAQKLIFVHELACNIRKTQNGFYDILQKTPLYNKEINKAGATKSNTLLYTDEGGWQLESEIFSVFMNKVCDKQIFFLNTMENWKEPVDSFKENLKNCYSEDSNIYQLGRGLDGLYSLERRGHNKNN